MKDRRAPRMSVRIRETPTDLLLGQRIISSIIIRIYIYICVYVYMYVCIYAYIYMYIYIYIWYIYIYIYIYICACINIYIYIIEREREREIERERDLYTYTHTYKTPTLYRVVPIGHVVYKWYYIQYSNRLTKWLLRYVMRTHTILRSGSVW